MNTEFISGIKKDCHKCTWKNANNLYIKLNVCPHYENKDNCPVYIEKLKHDTED